jgi:hypothetical protein
MNKNTFGSFFSHDFRDGDKYLRVPYKNGKPDEETIGKYEVIYRVDFDLFQETDIIGRNEDGTR